MATPQAVTLSYPAEASYKFNVFLKNDDGSSFDLSDYVVTGSVDRKDGGELYPIACETGNDGTVKVAIPSITLWSACVNVWTYAIYLSNSLSSVLLMHGKIVPLDNIPAPQLPIVGNSYDLTVKGDDVKISCGIIAGVEGEGVTAHAADMTAHLSTAERDGLDDLLACRAGVVAITSLSNIQGSGMYTLDVNDLSDTYPPNLAVGQSADVLFNNVTAGNFQSSSLAFLHDRAYLWGGYHLQTLTIGASCVLRLTNWGGVYDEGYPDNTNAKIAIELLMNMN